MHPERPRLIRAHKRLESAARKVESQAFAAGVLDLYYAVYFTGQEIHELRGLDIPAHNHLYDSLEAHFIGPDLLDASLMRGLRRIEKLFITLDQGLTDQFENSVMQAALETVRRFMEFAETLPELDEE